MVKKGSASPMPRVATRQALKAGMIDPCSKVNAFRLSSDYM